MRACCTIVDVEVSDTDGLATSQPIWRMLSIGDTTIHRVRSSGKAVVGTTFEAEISCMYARSTRD